MPLYLDNAATSFPKPPEVFAAVAEYGLLNGSTPGRGTYGSSRAGGEMIHRCRRNVLALLGLPSNKPEQIVFGLNCSDVNNLAIHGIINHARLASRPVQIVTTELDHNSVLRPIRSREADGVKWTCVAVDPLSGKVNSRDIATAVRSSAKSVGPEGLVLLVMTHASNVLGSIQPVEAVGRACREITQQLGAQVVFMLDASQTAGHVRMNAEAWNVDLWTAPGHKGLLGPMGTGVLWIRPGLEQLMSPLRQGGTGSRSELDTQPTAMPDKFEPGSHNAPGLAGLNAALEWIARTGIDHIAAHEHELVAAFLSHMPRLREAGYTLLGPSTANDRVAIFSLIHRELDAHTLAALLETEHDILARAGLHCAPRAHGACGTTAGGAVRLSFNALNSTTDANRAAHALCDIAGHVVSATVRALRADSLAQ